MKWSETMKAISQLGHMPINQYRNP
jgi:hypothetical protein